MIYGKKCLQDIAGDSNKGSKVTFSFDPLQLKSSNLPKIYTFSTKGLISKEIHSRISVWGHKLQVQHETFLKKQTQLLF